MGSQQQADNQRAEIPLDAQRLEQRITQYQGQQHAEQDLHLAVAQSIQQLAQQGGQGNQQHQTQRPGARQLAG